MVNTLNGTQIEILKNNFIYFKDASIDNILELAQDKNIYFFDTENSPIFPKEIVNKYNLTEIEYNTLSEFKDLSDSGLLTKLKSNKELKTKIYMWMFGANNSNNVYWGNTIQEFMEFIDNINLTKIEYSDKKVIIKPFEIYVHNLTYDLEFILYYLKDLKFKQIKSTQDKKKKKDNKKLAIHFDVTHANNSVYNATIQYKKHEIIKTRKNKRANAIEYDFVTTLFFKDSLKITNSSLKDIGSKFIDIDQIYLKDSGNIKYNLVRDNENYKPTLLESWYCYCDIYILQQWYNQFIKTYYLDQDIKPYTISQISFELILRESFKKIDRSEYFNHKIQDVKLVTDKMIYDKHFELDYIDGRDYMNKIIWDSYKGGHTTASRLYSSKSDINEVIKGVSIDITSSYPSQMVNKPLPYGKPVYYLGEPKKEGTLYDKDDLDSNGKPKNLDYHFVTIAFDGWYPKNPLNQFGLNVKLRLNQEDKEKYKIPSQESVSSNIYDIDFIGSNRIIFEKDDDNSLKPRSKKDKDREKLIKSYNNNYIVTVPYNELESWKKDYIFITENKQGDIIEDVLFIDTLSFKSEIGFFKDGLMHYYNEKEKADLEGNTPKKENAKTIINSFYGKNASKRDREQRFYNFTDDSDIIKFHPRTDENNPLITWQDLKLYAVHYASAVTSYGRIQLRDTARTLGNDKFIYADTDSLKFEISKELLIAKMNIYNESVPDNEKIHISFKKEDKQLGFWDFEYSFNDFKVVGQKKYMYLKEGKNEFTCKCAGLPKEVRNDIKKKEDFSIGKEFIKMGKTKVPGGYLLTDQIYTLNDLIYT